MTIENRNYLPEGVALLNRTLGNEWYTIVVLGATLPDTVPVNGQLHALHVVLDVDHDAIVLAHLYARSGDHPVNGEDTTLDTIGQNALTVAPDGVGSVRCAYLASATEGGTEIQVRSGQVE